MRILKKYGSTTAPRGLWQDLHCAFKKLGGKFLTMWIWFSKHLRDVSGNYKVPCVVMSMASSARLTMTGFTAWVVMLGALAKHIHQPQVAHRAVEPSAMSVGRKVLAHAWPAPVGLRAARAPLHFAGLVKWLQALLQFATALELPQDRRLLWGTDRRSWHGFEERASNCRSVL